jgi:tRNA modification GTPase
MGAIKNGSLGPVLKCGSIGPGGSDIVDQITLLITKKFQVLTKDDPILIDRHRQKILEISTVFDVFANNISNLGDIGIISSEARILDSKISELIGVVSADDVLNNIFSNFCIGK